MTTLYARRNDDGVSVNESAVCEDCLHDSTATDASYELWAEAEDTTGGESTTHSTTDSTLYPIDNCDGVCNGCSATNRD